jgi:hypothetical protein
VIFAKYLTRYLHFQRPTNKVLQRNNDAQKGIKMQKECTSVLFPTVIVDTTLTLFSISL